MALGWRRSWWVRGALLVLLCLSALVVAWTIWWWRAKSAFDAEVAAFRARGGITSLSDIHIPDIPAHRDATVALGKALAAFTGTPASPSQTPRFTAPPMPDWPPTPAWMAQAKAAISANGTAISLAVAASALPEASPSYDPATGTRKITTNNVSNFARLLSDAALYYHAIGDDAAAADCLLALQTIPRVYSSGHTIIESLIAIICQGIASPRIHFIATGLRVEGTASAADAVHPATRKQVEQLVVALADDRTFAAALPHGLSLMGGAGIAFTDQSPGIWVTRPLLYRYEAMALAHQRQEMIALDDLDWSAAEAARSASTVFESSDLGTLHRLLTSYVIPQFSSSGPDLFAAVTARRMATTALAFRLYVLDHGRYPHDLAELVPAYLSAIPTDPYSAGHDPLGYGLADGNRPPVVVSTGPSRSKRSAGIPIPAFELSVHGIHPVQPVLALSRVSATQPTSGAPGRSPTASPRPTQTASPAASQP